MVAHRRSLNTWCQTYGYPKRLLIVRADSAYYCYDIIATARRAGARFSTARQTATAGSRPMSAVYGYHAVLPDSSEPMLAAEATHRDHAIIEQVIAGLKDTALAHRPILPAGSPVRPAGWAPHLRRTGPGNPDSLRPPGQRIRSTRVRLPASSRTRHRGRRGNA